MPDPDHIRLIKISILTLYGTHEIIKNKTGHCNWKTILKGNKDNFYWNQTPDTESSMDKNPDRWKVYHNRNSW